MNKNDTKNAKQILKQMFEAYDFTNSKIDEANDILEDVDDVEVERELELELGRRNSIASEIKFYVDEKVPDNELLSAIRKTFEL